MSQPPDTKPAPFLPLGQITQAAGILPPAPRQIEPFGDLTFLEMVGNYAQLAFLQRQQGKKAILCQGMQSLAQCRAALLGARQTGLPVMLSVALAENGRTVLGSDVLSVLLTMQALGAAGFGVCGQPDALLTHTLGELIPYAKIPLLLPECLLPPAAALAGEADEEDILAVWESGHCTLEEEFEYSEPVICSLDMSDVILQLENEGPDVLCLMLDTPEDAHSFSLNAHMARLPVAFLSNSEEALEMALVLYPGRAVVNSLCELPRETLERLASAYGATVV